jgi:phosphoribosyl 1,2-cyclic phosphodiesterase
MAIGVRAEQLPISFAPARGPALASLGSGSRGNGTVISLGGVRVLVDCGFTLKQTRLRLARLGLVPEDLCAVLVTHEHSDHVQGVAPLARQYRLPVYLSHGTRRGINGWDDLDVRPFSGDEAFDVEGVRVIPVPVPHDAREPTQFVLEGAGARLGVLTDLGHVTPHVENAYRHCDALLVEANHDREMLWGGDYPAHLKRRIASSRGHLSNDQTVALLQEIGSASMRHVIVGHISEQNNSAARISDAFAPLTARLPNLSFATQQDGSGWIEI